MDSEIKEKNISDYSNKEIELFLTSDDCIEAGVVLISNNEKKVKLGAMNRVVWDDLGDWGVLDDSDDWL